jgi:rhamnose utilization protein RhaD (predicted bifunctional aldolase and dehydrogenase)
MSNPYAPNPSVEAILHAIIPFRYVDHTHADAVVITNTPSGGRSFDRFTAIERWSFLRDAGFVLVKKWPK